MFHESPAATADMVVLPSVLGCNTLRRTVQVRASGPTPCGCPVARPPRLSEQARDPPATASHERAGGGQARPSYSRSLRSAQSRKQVPIFVVSRQQIMKYPG